MIDHLFLEFDENLFHVVLLSPLGEDVEFVGLDLSVLLIHAGKIGLGEEVHLGSLSGVVGAALDAQEIDTVVEVSVSRANNGAIPLSEGGIFTYTTEP